MYDYKGLNIAPKSSMSFASVAAIATFSMQRSTDVYALNAVVFTSPTTTATVLTYAYNPTPGSTTGQVVLGTVTIPVGAAIGKVYKRNIKPVSIPEGGELVINVTTASAAGAGQAYVVYGEDPESDLASPNVVVVTA